MTTPLDATALTPSESSAAEQSRRELQAKLNGLGGLGGRKLSAEARDKKLREACEGFESVFIQKMWQEMRNTIPKNGLMHGKEERFWQDMYDQELSKSMSSAGGIGLADMMYAQLSRNLVSASRSAAGTSQGRDFAPEAAPLLASAPAQGENTAEAAAKAPLGKATAAAPLAAIYDGAAPATAPEVGERVAPAAQAAPQAAAASVAAAAPGAVAANAAAEEAVELNPEVERALAALRSRQALQRQEEGGAAIPAAASQAQTGSAQRSQRPLASSGIELAQVARREAGDKLGSHAVRPPLHQPSPRHSADSGEQAAATATEAVADADRAQAATRSRNVRFSTNMRPEERARRGLKPIRVLNVDNVGVNSKAGAGIAAYHAANEAQAQATAAQGQPAQPGQPAQAQEQPASQPAQPGQAAPAARQTAAESFVIPPLTAADARI